MEYIFFKDIEFKRVNYSYLGSFRWIVLFFKNVEWWEYRVENICFILKVKLIGIGCLEI